MATQAAVKERGEVFRPHEVIATFDGRQSQFRRLVNPQPKQDASNPAEWRLRIGRDKYTTNERRVDVVSVPNGTTLRRNQWHMPVADWLMERCPYEVGMRLWVRETFKVVGRDREAGWEGCLEYRADHKSYTFTSKREAEDARALWLKSKGWNWTPSIHMPRWASRLTLEIESVRVERLQDITEEDAQAEGFERREHFIRLWDELNAGRGFAFDDSPWVWVITFRRL